MHESPNGSNPFPRKRTGLLSTHSAQCRGWDEPPGDGLQMIQNVIKQDLMRLVYVLDLVRNTGGPLFAERAYERLAWLKSPTFFFHAANSVLGCHVSKFPPNVCPPVQRGVESRHGMAAAAIPQGCMDFLCPAPSNVLLVRFMCCHVRFPILTTSPKRR